MNKLIVCVLALLPAWLVAQSSRDITLTNPNRPATVTVHHQSGAMMVEGWDKPFVRVSVAGNAPYEVVQDGNEILIKTTSDQSAAMAVWVPAQTNLIAKSFQQGAIQVLDVSGTLEVDSYNGAVSAENISGAAVISAWNGAISASFNEVSDAPMAFTSYNGAINLALPGNTNATVRANLMNGGLYSAFNEGEQPRYETQETDKGREKWQILNIGDGGPEYRIQSYNGGVSIERK